MLYGRLIAPGSVALAVALMAAQARAEDYELGRGLSLSELLTVGGYFSTEYGNGNNVHYATLDDLAVLAYGSAGDGFSYLAELESAEFYRHDFRTDTSESRSKPAIERLYVDYKFSDHLAIRAGKQITPIGYWSLQPINVLRETTSSPLFSSAMFPRFLSGLDVYGYAPFDPSLSYHVYAQATRDIDPHYINIDADSHYGLALQRPVSAHWKAGGSAGRYTIHGDGSQVYYAQANARYDRGKFTLFSEGVYTWRSPSGAADSHSGAAYVQGEYRFTGQHAAVVRGEYFNGYTPGDNECIGVLGYSFRPIYPVSFKLEVQLHDDDRNNKLLSSFSVLF